MSQNCQKIIINLLLKRISLWGVNNPTELIVESYAARPPSLRIAVVTETYPPEVNGVAMTLGKIVEGLLVRGHAVQVVRPRQGNEAEQPLRAGLDEVLSRGIPLPSYGELRFGLPSKNKLIKLWTENRPDIVHVVTEGPLGWSAVSAARKLKLPVTSSFHTNFESYSQHYGLGLLKSPIDGYLRKLHNLTQATMVPTRAMQLALQSRGYQHVTLLSRGVDTAQFSPAKRSLALRDQWGVGPEDLVFLSVGRLAKEKNVGAVIAAFQAIQLRMPLAKMVFVGDGPMRKSVEQACPGAIFAGVQKGEALAAHYASGDVFLFPSLTETFGNVVPEALASGLAVVSYACAAAQELITSEHNGVLVAGVHELDFVQTAITLAKDRKMQQLVRRQAAGSVAHLSWNAIFDSFVSTLNGVIERHGKPFATALPLRDPVVFSQPSA